MLNMTTHQQIPPVQYPAALNQPRLVVYGVHGRDQSPEFFQDLDDRLAMPGLCWMLPAAAENSWYPGRMMDEVESNQPHLEDALAVVESQLGELLNQRDAGGPRVVVLGFSQGACLMAEYLLRYRPPVDGVLLHTGGYMGPGEFTAAQVASNGLSEVAVELFCADEDPWVPLHRVKETASELEKLATSVTMTTYRENEHHINDDAVSRMRHYLEHVADR